MEDQMKIHDVQVSFDEYYKRKNISENTQNKLGVSDFMAVPVKYQEGDYYFAQETISFLKFCRQNVPEYSFDVLADGDIETRSLHSFDIWMPVIFVAQSILLPIAVNVISNYIYDKMKGREKEEAKVDLTLIVREGEKEKSIHYNGDARTFKETFEKIDLNEMWEK